MKIKYPDPKLFRTEEELVRDIRGYLKTIGDHWIYEDKFHRRLKRRIKRMFIKSLIFKFFAAFAKPKHIEDGMWTEDGDVYLEKKFKLRGSKAERLAAIKEWSKPENIAARMTEFEEQQVKLKANAKVYRELLGLPEEDPPLPDPLPDEFKGQQPSTIRAIMRQRREGDPKWSYKKLEHLKFDQKWHINRLETNKRK